MTKLAVDLFMQQIFINRQSAGDTEVNKRDQRVPALMELLL